MAWRMAGEHCSRGEDGCYWYHSCWQYLRILGLVATPALHKSFYLRHLGSGQASHRILVSGTSDYSLVAHAVSAQGTASASPAITAVDLCQTPLALCAWYGDHAGLPVETHATDIFAFEPQERFDCVTTDALLTRVPPERRRELIEKWAALTRDGGSLVTTVRIAERQPKTPAAPGSPGRKSIEDYAIERYRRSQGRLDKPEAEVVHMATEFVRREQTYPFDSPAQVTRLLTGSGYAVEYLRSVNVGGVRYVRVVARRP